MYETEIQRADTVSELTSIRLRISNNNSLYYNDRIRFEQLLRKIDKKTANKENIINKKQLSKEMSEPVVEPPPAKRAKIDYNLNDAISEKEYKDKCDSINMKTQQNLKKLKAYFDLQNDSSAKIKKETRDMEKYIKELEERQKSISNNGYFTFNDPISSILDHELDNETELDDKYTDIFVHLTAAIQLRSNIQKCKSVINKQYEIFNDACRRMKLYLEKT